MKTLTSTVLLSVYEKDKPLYFTQCLDSILNSSVKPAEIIIVQDGYLPNELKVILNKYIQEYGDIIRCFELEQNSGLAAALNLGLKHCNSDIIIRMDADDIMHPERIRKQLDFFLKNPDIDVVGSYIAEIDENNEIIKDLVKYPLSHEECYRYFKYRDCFAHPVVAMKRAFLEDLNGYLIKYIDCNQDTDLWYRGFLADKKYANIPEVLLFFRRTSDFYYRRSGIKRAFFMLKDRLKINKDLKFGISGILAAFLIFGFQLVPAKLKKYFYNNR